MSLSYILKYENEIKKNNITHAFHFVSVVARSEDGFLGQYKKWKYANIMKDKIVPDEKITWDTKRNAYLARNCAGYKLNPTYRRWLSLIAWGYVAPKLH